MLDCKIDTLYSDKISSLYGDTVKDQGIAIQSKSVNKNDFLLFGSSELGSDVPQNPRSFFPNKNLPLNINTIGRGYVQTLEHSLDIGALGSKLKGKKVGIVVSMQWFMDKGGVAPGNFQMNFSELQFYEFMANSQIPNEEKIRVAQRVYDGIKDNTDFKIPTLYARLYLRNSLVDKFEYYAFMPYFYFRQELLSSKDKVESITFLEDKHKFNIQPNKNVEINWNDEDSKATKMGKNVVTNNKFFVEDNYYTKYIKPNLDSSKGSYKNVKLNESREIEDLKGLIDTCKDVGAKPYIIIMPVNGYFYDHLGLSKEERDSFYNNIEEISKNRGVAFLNMADKEYEPYFMVDIMHLGWKGWLYVDKKITEFISSN